MAFSGSAGVGADDKELVGEFLEPNTPFRHSMEPTVLSAASTTRFPGPFQNDAIFEEPIDHVVVSLVV